MKTIKIGLDKIEKLEVVCRKTIKTGDWKMSDAHIFKINGKHYLAYRHFSIGETKMEDSWAFDDNKKGYVCATEVELKEIVAKKWVPVK